MTLTPRVPKAPDPPKPATTGTDSIAAVLALQDQVITSICARDLDAQAIVQLAEIDRWRAVRLAEVAYLARLIPRATRDEIARQARVYGDEQNIARVLGVQPEPTPEVDAAGTGA